ncbi:hypothetical protein [Staphylococcus phage vB_SauM-T-SE-E1]|nr:hypothetical protein [Staphylococcus phage vB_SauM-V1SA15]
MQPLILNFFNKFYFFVFHSINRIFIYDYYYIVNHIY